MLTAPFRRVGDLGRDPQHMSVAGQPLLLSHQLLEFLIRSTVDQQPRVSSTEFGRSLLPDQPKPEPQE
jgi:hypothetical protein